MAKTYYAEIGNDFNLKSLNLASTLEKLYAWEKKLYKEVKVWCLKIVKFLDIFGQIMDIFCYVYVDAIH